MRARVASIVLCLACAAPPVAQVESLGFDLVGTWYVLAESLEPGASDPDAYTGEASVWRFERGPGQLRWTLFASPGHDAVADRDDRAGPLTAEEVTQRTRGLTVTRRNAFEKTLAGSDASGWRSDARGRPSSASELTFARQLRIEGMPERPIFTRVETLGGVAADGLAGTIRYVAREVEPDRVAGDYERDGERVGRFAMWRIDPIEVRE